MSASEDLLTLKEVRALLRVSAASLRRWWRKGRFPAPLVLSSRHYRWRRQEVLDWLTQQRGQGEPAA